MILNPRRLPPSCFYRILSRCQRSFNVNIGLDEASCPGAGGLAGDELRAECTLSAAPIPGIEMIVQERLLGLQGQWEGLYFSCAYYSVLAG